MMGAVVSLDALLAERRVWKGLGAILAGDHDALRGGPPGILLWMPHCPWAAGHLRR